MKLGASTGAPFFVSILSESSLRINKGDQLMFRHEEISFNLLWYDTCWCFCISQ